MMTLEEISADLEIRRVLANYARGVDRWDVETLKSCYHVDATDDHTMFKGLGHDFADFIVDYCAKAGGVSNHNVTNINIDMVTPSRANVESYYIAYHQFRNNAGIDTLLVTGGRYLDRFEQRKGAWKIAKRICTIDWSREPCPNPGWEYAKSFPKIGPKGIDPMYGLFAER